MAYFDPEAAAAATFVTGVLAVPNARRVRGWRQRFLVALLGLSLINLVVVGVVGAVAALSGVALPAVLAVPLSVVAILCGVASVSFHLPSLIVLGVDEVLERHGVLVTTLGQIAELLILAGIFAMVTYPWGGHDENGPTETRRALSSEPIRIRMRSALHLVVLARGRQGVVERAGDLAILGHRHCDVPQRPRAAAFPRQRW